MNLDRDRPEILTPPGRPAIAAPTPRVPMPERTFAAIKDPASTNISPGRRRLTSRGAARR